MAQAVQPFVAQSQLRMGQMGVRQSRRPTRDATRSPRLGLPSRQKKFSTTQRNMMKLKGLSPMLKTNIERGLSSLATSMLEDEARELLFKSRLQEERKNIELQMRAFKLPEFIGGNFDTQSDEYSARQTFEDTFLKILQTPEFKNAVKEQANKLMGQRQARIQQKNMAQAAEKATGAAQEASKQIEKVAQSANAAGKFGWDVENGVALVDVLDIADAEIPTVFTILVQMYRACTAVLNDGEKLTKGPLAFLEPPPLFRFWSMKDIKNVTGEAISGAMVGGATEIENTVESMIIGWPEATIGFAAIIGVFFQYILPCLIILCIIVAAAMMILSPFTS